MGAKGGCSKNMRTKQLGSNRWSSANKDNFLIFFFLDNNSVEVDDYQRRTKGKKKNLPAETLVRA